jgi:hypothetical protein
MNLITQQMVPDGYRAAAPQTVLKCNECDYQEKCTPGRNTAVSCSAHLRPDGRDVVFKVRMVQKDTKMEMCIQEGFWGTSPQNTHPPSWPTPGTWESESAKLLFLAALKHVEQNTAELNIYRGISVCCICHQTGSDGKFTAMLQSTAVEWPSNYRHYVEAHSVVPSPNFLKAILALAKVDSVIQTPKQDPEVKDTAPAGQFFGIIDPDYARIFTKRRLMVPGARFRFTAEVPIRVRSPGSTTSTGPVPTSSSNVVRL